MKFSSPYYPGNLSPETTTTRFFPIMRGEGSDINILKHICQENLRPDDVIANNSPENRVVGIKFDNIYAGNYRVLEHTTQRRVFSKKLKFLENQAATLQNDDFLVRALECNEPAVLCQSTFH